MNWLEHIISLSLVDHRFGVLSLLPNLLKGFGWNPGKKLLKWFGKVLEETTENADITFSQVGFKIYFILNLIKLTVLHRINKVSFNSLILTLARYSKFNSGNKEWVQTLFLLSLCLYFKIMVVAVIWQWCQRKEGEEKDITWWWHNVISNINPYQSSIVFHIETSHLICTENQMTVF